MLDFLAWLLDGFWDLVAILSGWRPDPMLKSQLETAAAAFGILGGGYTAYQIGRRIVTGRSITDEDAGKVAGEVLGSIDDKLEALIEQRLKERFAAMAAGTGADAGTAGADGGGGADDSMLREALAGIETVAREGGAAGRKAIEAFAATGDAAPGVEALKELAARHEASREEAGREAAEVYRQLGALAFLNDTHEALAAYRKATERDPDNADGWNQLGTLLHRLGHLDEAIAAYERVLALGNKSADKEVIAIATGNLGIIYKTRGDMAAACTAWRRAHGLFAEVGMTPQMDQVAGLLKDAGCPDQ